MDSPLPYQHLPRLHDNKLHVTARFMNMNHHDRDSFNMSMMGDTLKEDHHEDKSFVSSLEQTSPRISKSFNNKDYLRCEQHHHD